MEPITHVGMDVHKRSIVIAMLRPDGAKPVEMQVPNDTIGTRRLIQVFKREGEVPCCYEAGPCGFGLQRKLEAAGIRCRVIAPSLIPGRPGDRIKTDRRDARKLGELLRAGLLTEVHSPTPEEEAVRDITRCVEDAKQDLMRARHRLSKLLLRRGHDFTEGRAWTAPHRRWLKNLSLELQGPVQITFDSYLLTIEQTEEGARALEKRVSEIAQTESYREAVGWLRCFRGIDTLSAMILLAEIHGFDRFVSPSQFAAYIGLVPSEHSSSDRIRRGAITRAGNSHARRILVEGAWHYRHTPGGGIGLKKRREGQPLWAIAIAQKAERRLHARFWKLTLAKKPYGKVVTALARELATFVWAMHRSGQL